MSLMALYHTVDHCMHPGKRLFRESRKEEDKLVQIVNAFLHYTIIQRPAGRLRVGYHQGRHVSLACQKPQLKSS